MTDCTISAPRSSLQVGATWLSYCVWPGAGRPVLLLHGITNSAGEFWRLGPALGAMQHAKSKMQNAGQGDLNDPPLVPPAPSGSGALPESQPGRKGALDAPLGQGAAPEAQLGHTGALDAPLGNAIYALDLPGHGESDVSERHHIDAIAACVGGLIEQLDLADVTLIGHSWGGAVSLALASGRHPARARLGRVALLDPATGIDPAWGAAMVQKYAAQVGRPAAEMAPQLRALNPDWHACDLTWKTWALERCRLAQVEGFFVGGGAWDLAPRVAAVSVPMLFLVADPQFSVLTPRRIAAIEAQLRPGLGRLEIVPGAAHNMLRGQSYAPTRAALMGWLAEQG